MLVFSIALSIADPSSFNVMSLAYTTLYTLLYTLYTVKPNFTERKRKENSERALTNVTLKVLQHHVKEQDDCNTLLWQKMVVLGSSGFINPPHPQYSRE